MILQDLLIQHGPGNYKWGRTGSALVVHMTGIETRGGVGTVVEDPGGYYKAGHLVSSWSNCSNWVWVGSEADEYCDCGCGNREEEEAI